MYKIGDFSNMSKITIKTLRYYEKMGLLIPSYVDKYTNYRFYESNQLLDLSKIISLRQLGFSIKDIKSILSGHDIDRYLNKRKEEIEKDLIIYNDQLSKIKYFMEEKNMKYEVITKVLPDYTVYYKEGVVKEFTDLVPFILGSAEECTKLNPDIKCIEPEYCYVSYLDKEYKEKDIKVRYAQAVTEAGKENESIHFETLKPIEAVCTYHKGSYSTIREAYSFLLKYVEDNNLEIAEPIRERYIDGMWNKDSEEDWLTEIQIPVHKK